jgi:ADP-heptose:LPS heptosyltransferase
MKILLKLITLLIIKLQLIIYAFSHKNNLTKNTLLIAPYRLGDFCMWLPFASEQIKFIKQQGYSVTILIPAALIDFAMATIEADDFSIHPYGKYLTNPIELIRFAKKIRRHKYSVAVSVSIERDFFYNDLPLIYSNAKKIYLTSAIKDSPALCCRLSRLMDKLFFHETISITNYRTHSELDNYYVFTKTMLQKVPKLEKMDLSKLPQAKLPTNDEYILIFPTTQDQRRNWSENNFQELIKQMLGKYKAKIVIAGTSSDYDIGERFAKIDSKRVINYCGKSSLLELVSIIKSARLVIGNDSGGLNMAVITGTSTVTIMGEGVFRFMNVPDRFKSIGLSAPSCCRQTKSCVAKNCNWQCRFDLINGRFPCVSNVKLEGVFIACTTMLNN